MTEAPTNLMPEEFWDDEYYGDPDLPLAPSDSFSYERALAAALADMAPVTAGGSCGDRMRTGALAGLVRARRSAPT